MAATQSAAMGLGVMISGAVLLSWRSSSVEAMEHQKTLRRTASGKYVDGDGEMIKRLPERMATVLPDFTPQSPEQITQLRMLRHESTGKPTVGWVPGSERLTRKHYSRRNPSAALQ